MFTTVSGKVSMSVSPQFHNKFALEKWWLEPCDSKWHFDPLVGGHLTFERVAWPSQKGHKELPGRWSFPFEIIIFFRGFSCETSFFLIEMNLMKTKRLEPKKEPNIPLEQKETSFA